MRSAIAGDVEYAEFGVQCFQTLPQPLCSLKVCRVLVAEIEMVCFVLFCFVLFVLQLSFMPQWAPLPLRGLSRTYTMGLRVTGDDTRCRIAT